MKFEITNIMFLNLQLTEVDRISYHINPLDVQPTSGFAYIGSLVKSSGADCIECKTKQKKTPSSKLNEIVMLATNLITSCNLFQFTDVKNCSFIAWQNFGMKLGLRIEG